MTGDRVDTPDGPGTVEDEWYDELGSYVAVNLDSGPIIADGDSLGGPAVYLHEDVRYS